MSKRTYALALLWLSLCVAALWFANSRRAIEFDPQGVLQTASTQNAIRKHFADGDKATLVLVTDSQCPCQQVSQPHQRKVKKQASALGLAVVQAHATEFDKNVIPSVPAALFIDEAGTLAYAGPLSVGLGCAISDGIIDLVLENHAQGYQSSMFISDVKGCYCRNK